MGLKRKLRISFFIIILLPIIMIVAMGKLIVSYQANSIQQAYDVEYDPMQLLVNPIQLMNRLTRNVYNKIKLSALKTPKDLENIDYIDTLNKEVSGKYSFLVVRKNKEIIYSGNKAIVPQIMEYLPQFGVYNTEVDGGMYVGGEEYPMLLKQQDFYYSDNSEGTIFVITNVNNVLPQIRSFAAQAVISFVGIMILTALTMMVWLYRSIIQPLDVLKRATKEMKQGNLNFSIASDSGDEIGELCGDFEDMRIHLKELIEVQLRYEQESRELVSNISHDLKTPLTAIKGYTEGILDGVADTPEKHDKYLRTIYTKANDMSVLVDELSLYSKIDSNNVPYVFSSIVVGDYFGDCIEELSLDLELKEIKLGYENMVASGTKAIADPEQLKRVISNIIANSVKYLGKEEGHIFVRIKELGEYVQVEIEDDGIGIPAKDLPYIFDRFYRADASRNSKKGGTGLGLSIAKKIMEEHKGHIWATSIEGSGTTIFFTIPKWVPEVTVIDEKPSNSKRLGGGKRKAANKELQQEQNEQSSS